MSRKRSRSKKRKQFRVYFLGGRLDGEVRLMEWAENIAGDDRYAVTSFGCRPGECVAIPLRLPKRSRGQLYDAFIARSKSEAASTPSEEEEEKRQWREELNEAMRTGDAKKAFELQAKLLARLRKKK